MIEVANVITITDLSDDQKEMIKNDLTLTNPVWDNATRMGLALWGIPKGLQYFKEDGDSLITPAGYLSTLKQILPNQPITDSRFESKKLLNVKFVGTLRDYQEEAGASLLSNTNGVLCALGGAGKTVMMIKLICDRRQPTLILVNTKELANQFIARLLQFTDLKKKDIGFLGSGKKNLKPITVGILQSVVKADADELNEIFGMVLVDECHICPAETYARALSKLNAKYKYGASGTPSRSDGLTQVIFWITGPIIHTIDKDRLGHAVLKPTIQVVETDYTFPLFSSSEYGAMITDLSIDTARNKLIVETAKSFPTQQMALLCQRKDQIRALHRAIPSAVTLHGDMNTTARKATMDGLISGKHRIVITTYALFSKGIDLDNLEIMFFCAPVKNKEMVTQAGWRIVRRSKTNPNKKPIIVDFADKKVELLKYQFYTRQRTLKKLI